MKKPAFPLLVGPNSFVKNIAADPDGSKSTRSDSNRSTPRQVRPCSPCKVLGCAEYFDETKFRVAVIGSDFSCLVTDADYEVWTLCHIIPQNRPDVSIHLVTNSSPLG